MTFIIDILRRGDEHGNINIPIIKILSKHQRISHIWIAEDSTSNQIFLRSAENLITQVDVLQTKKYKWITSTLLTIKILIRSRKAKVGTFFLSTTPLQNLLITVFTIFQRSNIRHYVLLHGELSYLISPIGFGRRLGKLFLVAMFKVLPFSHTTQVTLAYPVLVALKNKYKIKSNLINLEMPIDTNDDYQEYREARQKIRIGSFGVHSKDKSSDLIYELSNYLAANRERFEIVTIGVASSDFIYDQDPMVRHYCRGTLSNALIPRSQFEEELKRLDVALFFYGNNPHYEMVSSGAFIDCISYSIPFAALSNNYLTHYIKKYGEIGIVRATVADLAIALIDLSNNDSIIKTYRKNLRAARDDRNYERFESDILKLHEKSTRC